MFWSAAAIRKLLSLMALSGKPTKWYPIPLSILTSMVMRWASTPYTALPKSWTSISSKFGYYNIQGFFAIIPICSGVSCYESVKWSNSTNYTSEIKPIYIRWFLFNLHYIWINPFRYKVSCSYCMHNFRLQFYLSRLGLRKNKRNQRGLFRWRTCLF